MDDPNLAITGCDCMRSKHSIAHTPVVYICNKLSKTKIPVYPRSVSIFATLLIIQNILFMFFLLVRAGFHGPGMGFPVS